MKCPPRKPRQAELFQLRPPVRLSAPASEAVLTALARLIAAVVRPSAPAEDKHDAAGR